jgi:lipid-binding SYLF domain-containing protein
MKRRNIMVGAAAVALASSLLGGCTTNTGATATSAERRMSIDRDVVAAMNLLYSTVPGSRELVGKARGVLVFPKVYEAGLGIGGSYGDGSLQSIGVNQGYYKTTSVTVGWQAGAQSRALIFLFMTQESLDKFKASSGWTAGADASVSAIKVGANGAIDTASASGTVNAFVLTNAGLFAGASVDGTKITKLDL